MGMQPWDEQEMHADYQRTINHQFRLLKISVGVALLLGFVSGAIFGLSIGMG